MTPSRLRKLTALTRGAAILSLGVSGCAKSEPIVNAPETQASAAPSTDTPMALPPRVVLNAPPQIPAADDDGGAPFVRRMHMGDGGRRPPFMNAPPKTPPGTSTP